MHGDCKLQKLSLAQCRGVAWLSRDMSCRNASYTPNWSYFLTRNGTIAAISSFKEKDDGHDE